MLIDLHLHSEFSHDSTETVEQMLYGAIDNNLSAVCFSEHVFSDVMAPIKAYEKALKIIELEGLDMSLFAGAEFTLVNNHEAKRRTSHVLIYDSVSNLEQTLNLGIECFSDLENLTGKKILAHPITKDLEMLNLSLQYVDGVEYSDSLRTARSRNGYFSIKDFPLVITGSDAHYRHQMGKYTLVKVLSDDVREVISSKNVFTTPPKSKKKDWVESFDPLRI